MRYTVTYEIAIKAVGLEAAADRAKRTVDHIKGGRLVAVYDPKRVKMGEIG